MRSALRLLTLVHKVASASVELQRARAHAWRFTRALKPKGAQIIFEPKGL